ncbi:MAG: YndJ family transporter [Acidimicrobiales bacterium]|nr:YndJ family transporter [Acidimicrobiales bacterium]
MIRSPAVHAVVGAAAWMVWALTVQPSWTSSLLMLSPAALVPLGLGLACRPDAGPTTPVLDSLRLSAGPAALLAMAAFVPERGAIAAAMTLPWLVIGLAAGVIGVGRFLSRRRCDPTVGVDAALVFLAVGAGWLTISRVGANPLGFSDAIVQLTAVHFHYAGFALPLVAGLAARHCGRGPLVAAWVILGVPVTAAGITAGGIVEWVAATMMATGGLATAGLLARTAVAQRRAARWLLLLAATSLATGMALALGWAWSIQVGWDYLDLDQMARWHGTLNAVGFGFGALAGLRITPLGDVPVEHLALHLGCPSHDVMSVVSAAAHRTEPTGPVGLLQRPNPVGYRSDAWTGPLPHGFEPACSALRHWVGHRAAGITIAEPPPPITAGQTVTMAIPVGPISVTAAARIIDVVDEADRYGFTYATLPHHPEDGEESFIITRDAGGDASYTVTAVWRTGTYASRALPPLTRYLQRRAISRYLAGVAGWPTDTEHEASRA